MRIVIARPNIFLTWPNIVNNGKKWELLWEQLGRATMCRFFFLQKIRFYVYLVTIKMMVMVMIILMIIVMIMVMIMVLIRVLMTTGLQRSRVLRRISFARLSFPCNCISSQIVRITSNLRESTNLSKLPKKCNDYCPLIEIWRLLKWASIGFFR